MNPKALVMILTLLAIASFFIYKSDKKDRAKRRQERIRSNGVPRMDNPPPPPPPKKSTNR